ncbi:MAG: DNA-directed polymerase subunit beta [Patescibacteria group bacterium]|nr:DNA-directed RNA polymerase subunit beta' [Candidatus Saccharibacteria bacterium]MDQ5963131.1 DNA-directed polymerase subunit beta [Patescibacteria group bacterium]
MRRYSYGTNIADFDAVRLAVASSDQMLDWSHGEVLKPETINYRTQKPERDGLFCERIFGPVKDINPHDAKYKGVRSREAAVDKNGELVTRSIVRRERMGHISLAVPVAHIWFLRGTPSAVGLLLGLTVKNLERVAYFASYIVKTVDEAKRDQYRTDKEAEFEAALEAIKLRNEAAAKEDGADVKALAEAQTKEIEEVTEQWDTLKAQLDTLAKLNLMSETDYRALPRELRDMITVGMGGAALKELLDAVDLQQLISDLTAEAEEAKGQRKKKLMKRLRLLESMERAGILPGSMCLSILPVIPPDLRPMVQLTGGRFATSDLNDLYRRVINRNNRLKKLMELNAPEVIRRNEQRMLQEAVDALIDNNNARSGRAVAATGQRRRLKSLSDMLKGKQGRFRQNLLGKRVDYSGRSVIVAGPELKISECGLPKMMALELFKPFVIGELIARDQAHNIRSATRMIETGETEVWDALDEVIKGKYVLLNRAPSLHRLSIQAFQPVLIEGRAIQLHPLVCKGFNADFDGDQMAVHLPLSDAAQNEARDIMAANRNLLKPADGTPILHIEQDIVLGCYYLTYQRPGSEKDAPKVFSSLDEASMAFDAGLIDLQSSISLPMNGELQQATLGRFFFNEIFPSDFAFQNEAMTKKYLQKVMAAVYKKYGAAKTAEIADNLKDLGFRYATMSGLSMGMDDFEPITGLESVIKDGDTRSVEIADQYEQGFITDEERHRLTVDSWTKIDAKVQDMLTQQMQGQDGSMAIAITSGARGNVSQMKMSVGMLGVFQDATGNVIELPVKSGYLQGLSPLEYFTGTRGTRKAVIDIALKTADAGYLTRRLVDVSQDVFTIDDDEHAADLGFAMLREDAKTIGVPYASRLEGRYAAEDIKGHIKAGELFSKDVAEAIEADEKLDGVKILSALSASSVHGVPQKSYGIDPATGELAVSHSPIGVIAAQSIGEPGTQLSLDSKHRSGAAVADDTAQGLTRIEELFEARMPKGQAYLTEIEGVANVWEEGQKYVVQITADDKDTVRLSLDGRTVAVADGSDVAIGDVVASNKGGADPLVAPVAGRLDVAGKEVVITPAHKSVVRYEIPGFKQLMVQDGDTVYAGQRLTNGSINLQDLMQLRGVEPTQRYIMNEILGIFAGQGQNIADKHLEIIVRQMFSRVQIEDAGDSEFVTGDVVSKLAVAEANEALLAAGKQPARANQLLLGITKASLSTDSFLSAASFQDTTRVLISAATSGRVDRLFGLKENVILGRKIPVGTGYGASNALDEGDDDGEFTPRVDIDKEIVSAEAPLRDMRPSLDDDDEVSVADDTMTHEDTESIEDGVRNAADDE